MNSTVDNERAVSPDIIVFSNFLSTGATLPAVTSLPGSYVTSAGALTTIPSDPLLPSQSSTTAR